MANSLGKVFVNDDGREYMMTTNGLVPNTPELESAAALGGTGAFLAEAMEVASFGILDVDEKLEKGFEGTSPVADFLPLPLSLASGASPLARGAA